ncbi:MAG: oligopeptidase B, partial [Propionibacteriaceae bacterium]
MSAATSPLPPAPPIAERKLQSRVHHGDEFLDPYEWLRDKEDPAVIAYLQAENAYTESQTAGLEGLREALFSEIKARTQETDLSVPVLSSHGTSPDGPDVAYWYYDRTVEGSEYSIYCRVAALPVAPGERRVPPDTTGEIAGEQVLLDGNVEAAGHEFFSLGAFTVSADGTLLAYSVDTTGGERFTLHVRDLTTGEDLPDVVEDTAYGVAWAGTSHLFYTRADEAWRPYVVRRHRLGTDSDTDVDVVTEPDDRFWVGVDSSRDDAWLVIGMGSKLTSEFSLLATSDPEGTPRVVAPRRQGVEYEIEPAGDRLLIVHN